jgi:hypothetical protein
MPPLASWLAAGGVALSSVDLTPVGNAGLGGR